MSKGRVHDITVRVRRKDGRPATREQARNAVWAAHEIARRGGNVEAALRDWTVTAIDWRHRNKLGREKVWHYTTNLSAVFVDLAGIFRTVGKEGLRVGVPDD